MVAIAVGALDSIAKPGEHYALRPLRFERDTAGVLITLVPTTNVEGGGGRVRVRRDGSAEVVERHQ